MLRDAAGARDGGDVDDGAPAGLAHGSDGLSDPPPAAHHVDLQDLAQALDALAFDGGGRPDGRVVDEHVERAETLEGRFDHAVPVRFLAYVVGDEERGLAEFLGDRLARRLLEIREHHAGTFRDEAMGVDFSHALGRARDDRHLAIELSHGFSPSWGRRPASFPESLPFPAQGRQRVGMFE